MLLSDLRLVPLQQADGLAFVPAEDIALVLPEGPPGREQRLPLPPHLEGRMTVVLHDGRVTHRPPLDWPAPLVEILDGAFVNPQHARKSGKDLRLPGGWAVTAPSRLPKAPPSPRSVSDVVYAKVPTCTTIHGQVRITEADKKKLAAQPGMVAAGPCLVNAERLRGLAVQQKLVRLELDPGMEILIPLDDARAFAKVIGVEDLAWLPPITEAHKAMYGVGLRDFPFVLLDAPAEALKAAFGDDLRMVIANLVWEAFRRREQGLSYGKEHRGFWYRPVLPVITRMGLRHTTTGDLADIELMGLGDSQYLTLDRVIAEMVGECRLVTYRDIGFDDERPQFRTVGKRRPDWLLAAEKNSLFTITRQVGEAFGVSTVVLGGLPKYDVVEFLAEDLRPHLARRVLHVVSYGDFDDVGWVIADALIAQLGRYGIEARLVGRLVKPKRFTTEEIRLFSEPIPQTDAMRRTRVQTWLKQSGGIGGKARGMHADHLVPAERVMKAFREETGLKP